MKRAVVFLLLLAAASVVLAVEPNELKRGSIRVFSELPALPIAGDVRFAGEGTFLFSYLGADPRVHMATINGPVRHFNLDLIPQQYVFNGWDDFTSDGHDVFVLTDRADPENKQHDLNYVSKFDLDGTYRSTVKLDIEAVVTRIVALGDDRLLAVAIPYRKDGPALTTDIFKTNGQHVQRLLLPGDTRIGKQKEGATPDPLVFENLQEAALDADSTFADATVDGTVLVMHPGGQPGKTAPSGFLINRYGQAKKLIFERSTTKFGQTAAIRLIRRYIVVLYVEQNDRSDPMHGVARVYDFDGKLLHTYLYNLAEFGMVLLDYDGERLYFATQASDLKSPKLKRLAVIEAVP